MAMRKVKVFALIITIPALCWALAAEAASFAQPPTLQYQLDALPSASDHVHFGAPVLPPIGHSRFCLQYPEDCEVHTIDFRYRNIALTPKRWNELNGVNREVNRDILPDVPIQSGAMERWLISPLTGDCKDYAVTKRHELLARGWPSRALLLSEVVVPSGEHHLVLVVRTENIDLVLDNLNANIRPIVMTYRQYQWLRIESPQNPKFWARVKMPSVLQTTAVY
jgi:predicted transglutaminase-like cysteine proteinase